MIKKIVCFLLSLALFVGSFISYPLTSKATDIKTLQRVTTTLEALMQQAQQTVYNQRTISSVPNIKANLLTSNFDAVKANDEFSVEYEIIPQDYLLREIEYYDEVIITLDVSSQMVGEKWAAVKNFFVNDFEQTLSRRDISVGIIPYHHNLQWYSAGFTYDNLLDLNDQANLDKIKAAFADDAITVQPYQSGRAIDPALQKAEELLKPGFNQGKKQAIIMINSGGYTVYDQNVLDRIEKYEFRVMTVTVSNGADDSNPVTPKTVHETLGGIPRDNLTGNTFQTPTVSQSIAQAFDILKTRIQTYSESEAGPTTYFNQNHNLMSDFDEVVIAIDASSEMYKEKWKQVKTFFKKYFIQALPTKPLKVGILPYTDRIVSPDTSYGTDFSQMIDVSQENAAKMIEAAFSKSYIYASSANNQRQIIPVLNQTKTLLEAGRTQGKKQALLLITSGDYHNYNDDELAQFKSLGYTIITVNIATSKTDKNLENAKLVHEKLGGTEENFLTGYVRETPTAVKALNELFGNVSYEENIIPEDAKDVKLIFDLGPNLEPVRGLQNQNGELIYPIGNITYHFANNKYHADPIHVKFTVRVTSIPDSFTFNSAVLSQSTSSGKAVTKEISTPMFNRANIPQINASLIGSHKVFDHYEVSYQMEPEPFPYSKEQNELKEIIFVLDTTANNGYIKKLIEGGLGSKIFDEFIHQNNTKVGLIAVDKDGNVTHEIPLTNQVDTVIEEIENISSGHQNSSPNLTQALLKADQLLSVGVSKNQSIVMINAFEDVKYHANTLLPMSQKYHIFSMTDSNDHTQFLNLHQALGGKIENYVTYSGNGHVEGSFTILLDQLNTNLVRYYDIMDSYLNFDMGEQFVFINALGEEQDVKKIKISVPTIRYELNSTKDTYIPTTKPIVTFKVKAIDQTAQSLSFKVNTSTELFNYLEYPDITFKRCRVPIEAPIFSIDEESVIIKHGLFTNRALEQYIKEYETTIKITEEMNYTFGVLMQINREGSAFEVQIPKQIASGNIKLYQNNLILYELNEDGTLNLGSRHSLAASNVTETNTSYLIKNMNFVLNKGRSYILIYNLTVAKAQNPSLPTNSFNLNALLDSSLPKRIPLQLLKDYLPDLL